MRRRSSLLHKVELKETRKSHIGQIIEKSAALRNNLITYYDVIQIKTSF